MYKIKLESFEGPFDLLVYLIENSKMNIYDIKVAEITRQYVDYLEALDDLDVEVATEFIVLAAVLINLKSKMLIPRFSENGEFLIEDDPRVELVHKLEEYKLTKYRAAMLEKKMEYFSGVFEKPQEDISKYLDNPDEMINLDVDQFAKAFILFLERKKKISDVRKNYQRVEKQKASIEERINQIVSVFNGKLESDYYEFSELIPNKDDNYDVALTFVSVLELMKEQIVTAEQEENYGNILVKKIDKKENEIE
ncbi:MAG TPA: segregation/condensation protein A [Anaerovoracaceae bacterium]|nr:segregation/condensation protein A [Anaerovoracaceae bacterium]